MLDAVSVVPKGANVGLLACAHAVNALTIGSLTKVYSSKPTNAQHRSRHLKKMRRKLTLAVTRSLILVLALSANGAGQVPAGGKDNPSATVPPVKPSPSAEARAWSTFQSPYYKRTWGVEIEGVRLVSSGSMIEFRYRVLDAKKAAVLNDKRWSPYLMDEASGAKMAVPTMEKIGQLRQTPPARDDHTYWMIFTDPNRIVKAGSKIDIVIGDFKAVGLVVQ